MKKRLLSSAILIGLSFASAALHAATAAPAAAGRPMEITINAWITDDKTDADAKLAVLKQMGVTSIQSYIYWNRVEKSPGVLDWSEYDAEVKLYQKYGFKWVPFVIAGPWYITPEFVRKDPEITLYRCLEHDRDGGMPSLWSPKLRVYVRDYLRKFAEHFRPMGVLESVNIGITGDYGEAIYSAIGNWPGAYHSHYGYWCGDPLAVADFQAHLRRAYPAGVDALNQAWKTHYASFDDIRPFVPMESPSERGWQEMLAWYRGAMSDWAEFWLATTRELFPGNEIYLCTGGDMAPEHGADFSVQAKLAAKYGAGIRITNESSSYPSNVRLTRMVASGGKFYGAYFGNEPAAIVTPDGILGRQFNALTSGARQLFTYMTGEMVAKQPDGTYAPGPAGRHYVDNKDFMRVQQPQLDVAVYQSNPLRTDQWYDRNDLGEIASAIRRFIDYDFIDDHLIRDGALRDKKILLVYNNKVMAADVIAAIRGWVERGGIAFFFASRGTDVDGNKQDYDRLLGLTDAADEVTGINLIKVRDPKKYPSIAPLADVFGTAAMTGQSKDCEVLLGMDYAESLGVAWRRPLGAGQVYAYFGPMDLKVEEQNWNTAKQLPLRFLKDSLRLCIADGQLKQVPPSMNLEIPDLYKVQTTAGLWVLNLQPNPVKVPLGEREVEVPAKSITLHQ